MADGFEVFYPRLLLLIDVWLLVFILQKDVLLQVYLLTVALWYRTSHLIKHLVSIVMSLIVSFVLFLTIRRIFTIGFVSQVDLISKLDAAVGRVFLNPWCFRLQLHRNLAFRSNEGPLDDCSVYTRYHVWWLDERKAKAWPQVDGRGAVCQRSFNKSKWAAQSLLLGEHSQEHVFLPFLKLHAVFFVVFESPFHVFRN